MNLLLSTSRHLFPQTEWFLEGAKRLLRAALGERVTFVIHDQNPDLMNLKGPATPRLNLQSDIFRHESLLPFSAVVFCNPDQWFGHSLENLYGLLEKYDLPLLVMGTKKMPREFTSLEQKILTRANTKIIKTELCSPVLFAHETSLKPRKNKIAFIAQETGNHQWLKSYIRLINHSPAAEILCPTVNDFMRFAPLFEDRARYFSDAGELLSAMAECELVVTPSPDWNEGIAAAGSKVFLFQNEEKLPELSAIPPVFPRHQQFDLWQLQLKKFFATEETTPEKHAAVSNKHSRTTPVAEL